MRLLTAGSLVRVQLGEPNKKPRTAMVLGFLHFSQYTGSTPFVKLPPQHITECGSDVGSQLMRSSDIDPNQLASTDLFLFQRERRPSVPGSKRTEQVGSRRIRKKPKIRIDLNLVDEHHGIIIEP